MALAALLTFDELVGRVILMARDATPRDTVELGAVHGLCLDLAADLAPELVDDLNSVDSLQRLIEVLDSKPNIVLPQLPDKSRWRFIRDND